MDHNGEFWASNGNSAREDAPFLSLTQTEIQQINTLVVPYLIIVGR